MNIAAKAATLSITLHPVTIDLLYAGGALIVLAVISFIIGSFVGDLNNWFGLAALCVYALLVDILLAVGSLL